MSDAIHVHEASKGHTEVARATAAKSTKAKQTADYGSMATSRMGGLDDLPVLEPLALGSAQECRSTTLPIQQRDKACTPSEHGSHAKHVLDHSSMAG